MKTEQTNHAAFTQKEPDHIISLDIASVKTLQIGYQAETIFLSPSDDDSFVLKEYINGLSGSEYYGKVTANRFKTTIKHGRREAVNTNTFIEVLLPASWHGELILSTQYGCISTQSDWSFERFAAESREGSVTLKSIKAPRIRINSSVSPIQVEQAEGFTDIHTVSGPILVKSIQGGAKLETSSAPIYAAFLSLNNIIDCTTLNGDVELLLPKQAGMKVDGISKTGEIFSEIEGLTVKTKPGNIKNVTGILGEKPFQNIRISTINGNISLHY